MAIYTLYFIIINIVIMVIWKRNTMR